jgi:co-chaperonin GroES (HSP10)
MTEKKKVENVIAPVEFRLEKAEQVNITKLGNFEMVEAFVKAEVAKAKKLKLNAVNLELLKKSKSLFVSLRTTVDKEKKRWANENIRPVKDNLEAKCAELQTAIALGENHLNEQIKIHEEKVREQKTVIFREYIAEFQEEYKLPEEELSKVILKEEYFNVTKKEKDVHNDILSQFTEIKSALTEKIESEKAIREACEGTVLNPDTFLEKLQFKSAIAVLNEINTEKQRLNTIEVSEDDLGEFLGSDDKITLGNAPSAGVFGVTKVTKKLIIEYDKSQAELLTKFFTDNKISVRYL